MDEFTEMSLTLALFFVLVSTILVIIFQTDVNNSAARVSFTWNRARSVQFDGLPAMLFSVVVTMIACMVILLIINAKSEICEILKTAMKNSK